MPAALDFLWKAVPPPAQVLRGLGYKTHMQHLARRLQSHPPLLHTEMVLVRFFPPGHAVAAGRKLDPGCVVQVLQGMPGNTRGVAVPPRGGGLRSTYPGDYAVYRHLAAKMVRRGLVAALAPVAKSDPVNKGVFWVTVRRLPQKQEAAAVAAEMERAVELARSSVHA